MLTEILFSSLALIVCGDCQKEYSDYASTCPKCARPTNLQKNVRNRFPKYWRSKNKLIFELNNNYQLKKKSEVISTAESKKGFKAEKEKTKIEENLKIKEESEYLKNYYSTINSSNSGKAKILIVDDQPAVLKILVKSLKLAGYQVYSATNGEEALESFHRDSPDLIVLEVMLPKIDGIEVCRRITAKSVVPIILLTALEDFSERVADLNLGADDYLSKPFSPKELEARITTILRRTDPTGSVNETREVSSGKGVMKFGSLVIDNNRRVVLRAGERVSLTYTEFSLLELLFDEPGKVVIRSEIYERLWGYPPIRAKDLRVVDVYVAKLRGKLEPDPKNPEIILTVRGIGYVSQSASNLERII